MLIFNQHIKTYFLINGEETTFLIIKK